MILPLTLMILLILAGLVATLLARGLLEPQIAANVLRGSQALNLAEAGAERTVRYLVANSTLVDCAMATADDGCTTATATTATSLFNAVNLGDIGTYTVTYKPLSFATLLIESEGQTSTVGATRKVRVVVTKHYTSKFGVLGQTTQVKGSARVLGNFGAIHGNTQTRVGAESAFIEQTATTASATAANCEGCTTPCADPCNPNASPPPHGVKGSGASGAGRPNEPFPTTKAADLKSKATVILGDNTTTVPSSCAGNLRTPAGSLLPAPQSTIVPVQMILNVLAIGTVAACTLTPENSGVFSGWRMDGPGQWKYNGIENPPTSGAFYASDRIEIEGNPGSTTSYWGATFIAGTATDVGKVRIRGTPYIKPYLGDLLTIANEVKLRGDAVLKGTVVATGTGDGSGLALEETGGTADIEAEGKVEVEGNVKLTGNIITNGRAKVRGNAQITYSGLTRTRMLGGLKILSWSTATQ